MVAIKPEITVVVAAAMRVLLAAAVGVPLGLLMGWSPISDEDWKGAAFVIDQVDPKTGKPLWHSRIGNATNAPETYMLDGRQYVVMPSGSTMASRPPGFRNWWQRSMNRISGGSEALRRPDSTGSSSGHGWRVRRNAGKWPALPRGLAAAFPCRLPPRWRNTSRNSCPPPKIQACGTAVRKTRT